MTTFICPSCKHQWTEGPTRDLKDDEECRSCLSDARIEWWQKGHAAGRAKGFHEGQSALPPEDRLASPIEALLGLLGEARNYVTDPLLRARIREVAPPEPRGPEDAG